MRSNINIRDWEQYFENISKVDTGDVCIGAVNDMADLYTRQVKKLTPVKKGILRKGWHTGGLKSNGKNYSRGVENDVPYGPYVNDGHVIRLVKGGPVVGYVEGQNFHEKIPCICEVFEVVYSGTD